ncbi:membrane protein [Pseudidiomarina salinarum]|uniref:Membrane protein n=1 Tax=Pseudidiomarina salinarum TaxID=435908 RepID=A0A094J063_9GAMM|nr:TonB-dependent receptor [Pseudidiomarina salinarum]KFZ31464.1 membrane protein [Pseudidiomarina salinarum]RUO70775.1 TonB-dependent receptor [Pseudidiomarina salinarum]
MFRKTPIAILIAGILPSVAMSAPDEQEQQHEHQDTEVITITATPLTRTQLNSAQPVSVVAGDELREQQAHTLGETLQNEPGISATNFAGVASSPIIRGLDGPRVKITQNGLDTGDVSRGSPDHAVTTETSVAQQIEILRGPATLLYGSGAIGGVVNVVDQRVPSEFVGGSQGFYGVNADTASDLRDASAGFTADHEQTVWHADGFIRRSDDYSVPRFTNDEGETATAVENSFIDAQGANVGVSYMFDQGYLGASYGRLEQEYGIPGHGHGEEEEHDEEEAHEEEAGPFANLTQNRIQMHGGWIAPYQGIEKLELRYGFTDYQHQEIEDNIAATTFTNEQHELRLTATHAPLAGWKGAFGYHLFDQQQNAVGEEAYTPGSDAIRHGLFWLVEQQFGAFNWQAGARYERVDIEAPTLTDIRYAELDFEPVSGSVGFTWQFARDLQFAVNFSHAQRAPAANELFSNGEHLATQTYELGLVYEAHEEGDHEYHIESAQQLPAVEKSNNLDIGFHIEQPGYHMDFTVFYNRINDYVFSEFTGINSEDLHQEGDDEAEGGHDHAEGLPVIAFTQRDVELFGYELSGAWQFKPNWEVTGFSDYIRGRATDGAGDLPRIPSQRIGTSLRYNLGNWEAKAGYIWHAKQTDVAINETPTDGYGLLSAQVNFFPQAFAAQNLSIYLKADNLTDELAFPHTSFLKEDAPLRGRNFGIGIRGEF